MISKGDSMELCQSSSGILSLHPTRRSELVYALDFKMSGLNKRRKRGGGEAGGISGM